MAAPLPHPSQVRRLLVRSVNWLGDAIMALPALERLSEAFPTATITLLTPAKLADLWPGYPHVREVLTFKPKESVFAVARRLRSLQCDLAVIFPNSPRSALECWLAGIPCRVGVARPWRNWCLTHPVPPRKEAVKLRKRSPREIRQRISQEAKPAAVDFLPASAHQVHDYLHLVAAIGANPTPLPPRLAITEAEAQRTLAKFAPEEPSNTRWCALNAGAEYGPAKRWPRARFIEAAAAIHRQSGVGWLVVGGPGDLELASQVCAGLHSTGVSPVINLAGKTSLRELGALFQACRAVLTNDTGPMHLAAAVGSPVVVPFGSTSPELTGPGLPGTGNSPHALLQASVACAPCFQRECPIDFRCMHQISVPMVVQAVLKAGRLV